MAEVTVEATAVAFRRGNHQDISVFKGLEGEMVVDLEDKTLVMCDGETRGGHPMARADFKNVDTKYLAEDLGHANTSLAYNDFRNCDFKNLYNDDFIPDSEGKANVKLATRNLSNLEADNNILTRQATERILKRDYKLASTNLENLVHNTSSAIERRNISTILKEDYNLASDSGDNIHTDAANGLADIYRDSTVYGKALAYADMANVNTEALAGTDSAGADKTAQGTPLAYNDFSNVDLPTALSDYEILSHKSILMDADTINDINYPTTGAVAVYSQTKITEMSANRSLSNIVDWTCASRSSNYEEFTPIIEIDTSAAGTGYSVGDYVRLEIVPTGGAYEDTLKLILEVTEVSGTGAITAFELEGSSDPITFEITSPLRLQDKTDNPSVTTRAIFIVSTSETPSLAQHGGELLRSDLTNVSEALNILKVNPSIEVSDSIRLELDHKKAQVYPIVLRDGVTHLSLNLVFPDRFMVEARNAYIYELHIKIGSVVPTLFSWSITSTEGRTDIPFCWLQDIKTPVDANKTALYVLRQQQGQVIANYAGSYAPTQAIEE